jgi:hypothetical protein
VRRTPGWSTLAGIALELCALAFVGYVVMGREDLPQPLRRPSAPADLQPVQHDVEAMPDTAAAPPGPDISDPLDFIKEPADDGARYYRAVNDGVELIAAFYSDGRVRLADAQAHRFAGMLQDNHADLLDLGSNEWSELFVRVAPSGTLQLELRGGPHDAHVLTCDTLTL